MLRAEGKSMSRKIYNHNFSLGKTGQELSALPHQDTSKKNCILGRISPSFLGISFWAPQSSERSDNVLCMTHLWMEGSTG